MKRLHEFYTAGGGTAYLIGNPAASAINAPKGQKLAAYKDATGNVVVDSQIGALAGASGGALLGGTAGALAGPLMLKDDDLRKNAIKGVSGRGLSKTEKLALMKRTTRGVGGLAGGVAGLAGGAIIGSAAGAIHGHFGKRAQEIRNRHLSADLKPALRELAARSERIIEFAMVRDANGQFVEVEDEGGMGVGTAVKAGAGVAALGGAGYGAYRGNNAVMSKFGTFGPMEAGKSRMVEAYKGAGAAGLNTVKKSGFGKGLRGALLGAARWLK